MLSCQFSVTHSKFNYSLKFFRMDIEMLFQLRIEDFYELLAKIIVSHKWINNKALISSVVNFHDSQCKGHFCSSWKIWILLYWNLWNLYGIYLNAILFIKMIGIEQCSLFGLIGFMLALRDVAAFVW